MSRGHTFADSGFAFKNLVVLIFGKTNTVM